MKFTCNFFQFAFCCIGHLHASFTFIANVTFGDANEDFFKIKNFKKCSLTENQLKKIKYVFREREILFREIGDWNIQ